MDVVSLKSYANEVFATGVIFFSQHGDSFNDQTMGQAKTVMARVQQAAIDQDLYRLELWPMTQKLICQIINFVDDTPEAHSEIEIFVNSAMKCGYIVAMAEKEFGWANDSNSISKQSETLLAATADALVREAARKNYHQLQCLIRALGVYCGYLQGRFGEDFVSSEIEFINYEISLGPR